MKKYLILAAGAAMLLASCVKKSAPSTDIKIGLPQDQNPVTYDPPISATWQVYYEMDGQKYKYIHDGVTNEAYSERLTHPIDGNGNEVSEYQFGIRDAVDKQNDRFSVTKGNLTYQSSDPNVPPDEPTFESFFAVANVPITVGYFNGVEIRIPDGSGGVYNSSNDPATQSSGNYFKIVDKQNLPNGVKIKCRFKVDVFSSSKVRKTLDNGVLIAQIGNI